MSTQPPRGSEMLGVINLEHGLRITYSLDENGRVFNIRAFWKDTGEEYRIAPKTADQFMIWLSGYTMEIK